MAAAAAAATSLASSPHLRRPPLRHTPLSPSQSFPRSLATNFSTPCLKARSQRTHLLLPEARKARSWVFFPPRAAAGDGQSAQSSERWVLEPVGDGDSRHIGYKVPLPGAFEIVSDAVTVGRLPERASLVIPVATVSGLHARLEKKEGRLFVTDLDSTNGTYIGEMKLRPGAVTNVAPGSYLTFGDTHLAMFRVSKLEEDVPKEVIDAEVEEAEMASVASGE